MTIGISGQSVNSALELQPRINIIMATDLNRAQSYLFIESSSTPLSTSAFDFGAAGLSRSARQPIPKPAVSHRVRIRNWIGFFKTGDQALIALAVFSISARPEFASSRPIASNSVL